MEREHLLPKGPQLDSKRENEHYQKREQRALQQPTVRDYDPLPTDPPLITQNYGAAAELLNEDASVDDEPRVPNDYSGQAWLSMLCCCFPLALPAVYRSDKVLQSIRSGDLEQARIHSEAARKLASLAVVYGILLIILTIGLYILISKEVTHNFE
ncbi:synapse differentiation-inducing gene protein 1-like isoform X1 [Hydractinia symbiolongicarpus]|uniref:synapse differentiation-inducing gene protein 1-like isoform X1 n=1 Tax=Hydractinia symbiolongicarpus TaxID=13093 RepID=UPI00254E73E4|nr:synapse differentiation-inducing gene protein 1-like isoform X1 [Hydractinia symbiolongicarpus]